jgi:hypothetical protein
MLMRCRGEGVAALDGWSAQPGRLFFKLSKPSDNSGGHPERGWFLSQVRRMV